MKRVTAVAAAVILAALAAVNLASAQGGLGKAPAGAAEKKIKTVGPNPSPTPSYDPSPRVAWDSGELQTQIGSKNKDKKKLVMRVWCEYRQDGPTTYSWQVKYLLKAENKNLVGPGWHEVKDLHALDYDLTYKIGGGAPVTKSGTISLQGNSNKDGVVAYGSNAPAKPTFTTNNFTGKRGGGSSGINLNWP
jgi:hypothetical protein